MGLWGELDGAGFARALGGAVVLLCLFSSPLLAETATQVQENACAPADVIRHLRQSPRNEAEQKRRAGFLSRALKCEPVLADPKLAAFVAYELSLFYAGVEHRDASRDFALAAWYADQAAAFLASTEDKKAWFDLRAAAARLHFYAANDLVGVTGVRDLLQALLTELPDERWGITLRSEGLLLLADIEAKRLEIGESGARRLALQALDAYLALSPIRGSDARAMALLEKGGLLVRDRQQAGPGIDDLRLAVAALQEATDLFRKLGDRKHRLMAQINLALTYVRLEDQNLSDNTEKGYALLRATLAEMDPRREGSMYSDAANNLASALFARQKGIRDQNLVEAIEWFRKARRLVNPTDKEDKWLRTSVNLALALEASSVNEEENLTEADAILGEVVDRLEKSGKFAETVKPLSVQFSVKLRWAKWGDSEKLRAAGEILEKATSLAARLPEDQRAALQADWADFYRAKYAAGDQTALDAAIVAYRSALALTDARNSSRLWATLQNNLGNACNDRRRPELYACARDAYEQALSVRTPEAMPREHVDTLVNLAKLDFDHENWDSAASLYQTIIREHRATFDQIEEEDIRLHTASQSKRWFERSAYALAKTGKLEEALWVAEQGKARLLKRKLGWIDPQGQENVTLEERLGTLEVKPGTIILVPIVTPHGTLVLALANLGRATVLRGKFLPEITGDAVVQRISGGKRSDQVQGGWLGAYDKAFAPKTGEIRGAGDDWNAELREIQEWLGKQLVQPVFSWLHDIGIPIPSVVVWITQGELSILPIHAAVMRDGRPLVDHATIIYAPTLTFFERGSLRLNRRHNRLTLVSIGNPTSDPKLPLSEVEAAASHSLVHGNSRMLTNAEATRPAVKGALLAAQVFHFAGHASFDREDPRQSYLLMAQRERLTVAELQNDSAASAPELVVLSACETGLIQVYDIANEFQGLPAAFLALGAQGVVSSLWPVKDGPALFLMYRFMQLRLTHGRDPASALREAQLWLRDAHGPDLAKVASRLGGLTRTETGKAFLSRMAWNFEHKPEWRPYSDPASWAGYVYAGRPM